MDKLRTEYRKWFWDGEFIDNQGANITYQDGQPYHPYSVFKAKDSTLGIAIANYEDCSVYVHVEWNDGSKPDKYRLIDNQDWNIVSHIIELPARSAAIIL
ncbi:MAG TPA: hypothetical protein GX505_08985 [Clostridiales bacterium]|nr:hypothetical protein [Clostridiales bacterium]